MDVLGSRFIFNTAPSLGGGLDLSSSTSMQVSDTIFAGNDTGFRGRSISSFYNTPGQGLVVDCQSERWKRH